MENYCDSDSEDKKSRKIIFDEKQESVEDKIVEAFRLQHQDLMKLNPEIDVLLITEKEDKETGEWVLLETPIINYIKIGHNLIFDNRLIPEEFLGIEVRNVKYEDEFSKFFLKEIKDEDIIPVYLVEDPKKYEKFVELNLSIIRDKLFNQDLSKEEALDALTGDFEKHKIWVKKMKELYLKGQNEG